MSAPLTPARQQYLEIKARYPDALLWYRLGDFYEMFDEDARVAAAALRITLTSRSFGKDCRVPMCGVPHHAQARFLARLVRQGFSVAICEQMSPAGKGLVEREVVRVVTPGTVSEPELLRPGENNYLCAVAKRGGVFGLAYVDVTTGEFSVTELSYDSDLAAELDRLQAAECLVEQEQDLLDGSVRHERVAAPALWDSRACEERLLRHLGAQALHMAGCEGRPAAQAAAGAILGYLAHTNRSLLPVLQHLRWYQADDAVVVDAATRTLLLGKHTGGDRDRSMLGLLDCTVTPMGARLLGRWLRRPLRRRDVLIERQGAVAALLEQASLRQDVRAALRPVGDLERLTARVGQERATAEELLALAAAVEALPSVRGALGSADVPPLRRLLDGVDSALDLAAAIRAAVAEPGGERLIRPGYDGEIDRLAERARAARECLLALEAHEREQTGIRSLRVSFNSVYGYYIEVTNPNVSKVPRHYVRKQTLAHAERFVTEELLRWETALAEAEAALQDLDRSRFKDLQQAITRDAVRLLSTAAALAQVDALCALAEVAETRGYARPDLIEGGDLHIAAGRHPLVEAMAGPGSFIPNDCILGGDQPSLAIITGPNMGGKSTFLRQVALIVYLAQVGSFVPAASATIGLADRIFARIGAHDDLAAGQSTFLLEMAETAAIVRLASPRSLVLLDEIGRGTTSSDGRALAQAVAEHLHEIVGARSLFATHYYELARAAEDWPGACNLHLRAEEHEGRVVFLYKVGRGIADRSFALHVARMAGMPEGITQRAQDLLATMNGRAVALPGAAPPPDRPIEPPRPLRVAEDDGHLGEVLEDVLDQDLASTTPMEALNLLYSLQQRARVSMLQRSRPSQLARKHRP